AWSENIQQKKEEEEKQIAEEQAAKARYWKIPIFYNDDEDYTIAITPKEPEDSLRMGDFDAAAHGRSGEGYGTVPVGEVYRKGNGEDGVYSEF
nr:hypothetical protein [Tanacetum cinerariifolium]